MPPGAEVPKRHCVRWGPSSPPTKNGTAAPHFLAHVCCGQMVPHLSNCWALVAQLMAECCRAHWRHLGNTIYLVFIGNTWWIRLNLCFLGPTRVHNPNGKSIGSAVFAQIPAECPYTFKIAPSHGGCWPPSNTWFRGPTRVLNPNGISIGSAVSAGLTTVTDRQTDRQTDHATRSVTIGRIYVRSTAMRPSNNNSTG